MIRFQVFLKLILLTIDLSLFYSSNALLVNKKNQHQLARSQTFRTGHNLASHGVIELSDITFCLHVLCVDSIPSVYGLQGVFL